MFRFSVVVDMGIWIPRTEVYNRFKLYDVDLPGGNIALLYQQATQNSTDDCD